LSYSLFKPAQTATRKYFNRIIASLLASFLLSACVSVPLQTDPSTIQLSEKQNWFLKARVAIKTPEENVSANLEWRNDSDDFDFHIYGLFGATYTHLIQQDDKATLKLPEDKIYYSDNAQRLMRQNLGWDFPIDALSFWIKGLPSGKAEESLTRDPQGQLQNIKFRDWKVEFSRYQSYSGYLMPRMIKATHPQMSLRIAVKKWNFTPSD